MDQTIRVFRYPDAQRLQEIISRPAIGGTDRTAAVMEIIDQVKSRGDAALAEYAERFDHVRLDCLTVTPEEIREALQLVPDDLRKAIVHAARNIRRFHEVQVPTGEQVETEPGVTCWRRVVPLRRVGLYVPGGSAPLFSTVLMLAIPAMVAGCDEIVLCTPPMANGRVHEAVLFAADLCGVSRIVKAGGAQAIAAMAYGTGSVPKVDKIFGPGNQYVTLAKQLVSIDACAVDMPAGPSEVLVAADCSADPGVVAADLLSQAEHGPDSQAVLVTTSEALAEAVVVAVAVQLQELPRAELAAKALANSRIVIVKSRDEVVSIIDAYAPEHLIILMDEPESIGAAVSHAGSVFIGHWTPESAGDYASGTNHTLPTYGWARAYSGVSVDSFLRKMTYQRISPEGLRAIGPIIETMARAEELEAHRHAVTIRLGLLDTLQKDGDQ